MSARLVRVAAVLLLGSGCWVALDDTQKYSCESDKDCGGDGFACFNGVCCNPDTENCAGTGGSGGAGGGGGSGGSGGGTAGCGSLSACASGCFDLLISTDHCGDCNTVCGLDEVCFAGTCAVISTLNPFIDTVTPTSAGVGASATVNVVGDRFASGALLRLTAPGLVQEKPLTVTDPQHASADLDLSTVQPGAAEVRVVNPGKLISNSKGLVLTGQLGPTPTIANVAPAMVPIGYNGALTVNGSNLDGTAKVQLSGGGLSSPMQLATVFVSNSQLYVQNAGLQALAAGSYQLNVAYTGGTTNAVTLSISGTVPNITGISPNHAPRGTSVTLTVNGTNFDASSQVIFVAGTNTNVPTTLVNATQVTAGPLDLTPFTAGNYAVMVRNSAAYDSNMTGFVVDSNDPTLISVSPAGGRQDQTVNLTLSGARFLPGAVVSISSATMMSTNLTTTYVSANAVQVNGLSLVTYALGGYQLVVRNPGSNPSASVSFTVTEGTPVLTLVNPNTASVSGTQPTMVTLTGTYFYASSVVAATGGGLTDSPLPTTYLTPTSLRVTQDLAGQQTGAYTLKVINPGSPAPLQSNTVGFTLNP